jgi:hypothetical protein
VVRIAPSTLERSATRKRSLIHATTLFSPDNSPVTSTYPASYYWGIQQTITYGTSTSILTSTAGIVDTGMCFSLSNTAEKCYIITRRYYFASHRLGCLSSLCFRHWGCSGLCDWTSADHQRAVCKPAKSVLQHQRRKYPDFFLSRHH